MIGIFLVDIRDGFHLSSENDILDISILHIMFFVLVSKRSNLKIVSFDGLKVNCLMFELVDIITSKQAIFWRSLIVFCSKKASLWH